MPLPISSILIAHPRFPPLADDYADAFIHAGVDARTFIVDDHVHWMQRYVFRRINKLARALRLVRRGTDLFRRHRWGEVAYPASQLAAAVADYAPDVVLCIHGKPVDIGPLRDASALKVGWWVEQNDSWPALDAASRHFDVYAAFSRDIVDTLAQHGRASFHLLHGANLRQHHPIDGCAKEVDVAFVGAWSAWRDEIIAQAYAVTEDIALYGHSWLKKSRLPNDILRKIHKGDFILGAELNALYNRARVVLNADRTVRLGLNMRYFEVLATRACLLTDEAVELGEHFADGEHLCVYRDHAQLRQRLRALLDDEPGRARIADNGYREVLRHHSCDQRVRELLAAVATHVT